MGLASHLFSLSKILLERQTSPPRVTRSAPPQEAIQTERAGGMTVARSDFTNGVQLCTAYANNELENKKAETACRMKKLRLRCTQGRRIASPLFPVHITGCSLTENWEGGVRPRNDVEKSKAPQSGWKAREKSALLICAEPLAFSSACEVHFSSKLQRSKWHSFSIMSGTGPEIRLVASRDKMQLHGRAPRHLSNAQRGAWWIK